MVRSHEGVAIGVGLGPRNQITEEQRQTVLDAAAVLQLRRSEVAAQLAGGDLPGAQVVARGLPGVASYMFEAAPTWRELHSVRPAITATQLRVSIPGNRTVTAAGLKMVSVFDADAVDLEARMVLANEQPGTYFLSVAPVQMKIVDRSYVLLQGPFIDGASTLMAASSPACLDAAWRYWETITACAFPVEDGVSLLGDLTRRQRQVVALMASGAADEAIAEALQVSLRTVRADVAALLQALGVRTRFAAGIRLQLWPDAID